MSDARRRDGGTAGVRGDAPAEAESDAPGDVRDLAPRYAPGEAAAPLVRALGGGLLGAVALLAVDGLVPSASGTRWLWPALVAFGGPLGTAGAGAAVVVVAGALGGLAFAYGRFRRFVPGGPLAAGLTWGALSWLAAAGLLPRAAAWLAASGAEAPRLVALAGVAVAESLLTMLVYGALVGLVNPRPAPPPAP